MTVIDAHAHIYPEKIASRAVDAVGAFYNIEMYATGEGTPEHLLAAKEVTPITHFIVHSVATTAHSVESINNFIAAQCAAHPEFIGFATMHHEYENPEREIDRARELGLYGVKLHPDTQKVNLDDPRLMDVYEILEARNMRLVVHTGDYRYDYSNPERLLRVLDAFPNLVVDAAHYGCWSRFEIGYDVLHTRENVFVDASSSMFFLGKRRAAELTRLWGTERVMFGSDYPMWSPAKEFEFMDALPFTAKEKERLFHKNAEAFLGFEVK